MATLLVRKDGSGTHTTIQSAIMASVDGDIIDIEAGLFEENIDLYKGVTLRGAGKNLTTIQGSHKANVVKSGVRTSGSNIINFSAGTEGFVVGRIITSSGVPANTRIVQVILQVLLFLQMLQLMVHLTVQWLNKMMVLLE